MADIREERIKRLQEIMSRRQDFASGKTVSDEETNNRIRTLDRVYNQRYLPQQADSWTNDFTAFAKKIQTDAQSRGNKYQSQDSLTTYRDSISGQLSDLIDRSKYAKKYAESSGNTAYQSYVDESIKYLTDIAGSLQKEQDYWGQWADEDAYKNSPAYFVNEFGEEAKKYNGGDLFSTGLATAGQNIADNGRDIYETIMGVKKGSYWDYFAMEGELGYDYLNRSSTLSAINKEEEDLYWYLRDKVSKEEADRYYKSISAHLAERAASEFSAELMKIAGDNQVLKDALATLYSIPAGYSSALTGMGNTILLPFGETAAPDVAGKTHQYNKQNLSDVGRVFADLGYTSGNMLPSIAVSYVTGNPLLGAGTTAMTSGGNAYAEAISQGYSREQATAYGVINGVLEGGLQYVLGGIGDLGGIASGKLINKIGDKLLPAFSNIKSGVARAILSAGGKYLGKAASEAFEEGLQAILDPLVRNMVFQEDNNIDWNEVGYSAMLGAMSAGLWEGGSIAFNSAQANAIGKKAFDNGSWQGAVDYALKLDPNSKPYKLAKGLQDGSIKADGNNVGNLYSALVEYMQESSKLVRKGKMTTDQYVSAQKAIAQIYEARTQAETKATQGAETAQNNVSANILNNDIYNAVKAVQTNEKAAVRQANIIARILNGDSSVSSAQIDEVSGKNSSVRNVLKSATGIDLGITNADARKAVKAYISEKAAAVNVQQPSEQAQESDPGMTAQQTEYDKTVKESDKLSAVFGEKGQAAYKEFSKGMKLSDSLLYFNDAFIRFYNQGVEAASKKNSPKKYRDINGFEGISSLIKQRAYEAGLEDAKNKSGTIAEFVQKAHEVTEKAAQDEKEIKERQKAAKKVAAKQFSVDELAPTAGKWNIDPKIDMGNLSEKQSASLNYLKTVSEVSGINITLISGIDANGDFSVENGYYDGTTNTVYVSINAGMQSIADITHSAMLKTAAHEITHYIAKSGTDAYTMLEDYIVNEFIMEYGKDGLARRISDIQEAYKDALNKDLTYEKAKEEMVANACEMMLKNSNTFEKLAMNNMTLAQKLKAGLDSFVSKFNSNKNAALEGLEATSLEARMLARSESSLKTAQKLWDNALKGAIKENQNKVPDSKVTIETTEAQNKNVMQNLRTMTEDYWEYRNDTVLKGLLTSKEYDTLFNTINVIMDKARKNPDILDFGADIDSNNRPFSSIKSNSDPLYKVSLDFSTLCRKRLLQQAITNRLQAKLKRSLTAKEQTAIRNELVKLRKEGKKIEVACALCYVEAARLKSPNVINDFLDNRRKYAIDYFSKKNKAFNDSINKKQGDYLESKGLDRDTKMSDMPKNISSYLNKNKPLWRQQYTPTAYETEAIKVLESMDSATMLSPQGLAQLKINNPLAYDIFISRVRTATKSKAQETNVAFKRGDSYGFIDGSGNATVNISDALIEEMNKENGLRYQSWSDFQAFHILDNIAAVMELATRNAKMQTYTKVPDFVMLNGKTGMMINMSLIAKGEGLNTDGTFAFSDIEGMSYEESLRLRDMFPDTAGNIVVAVNDRHLKALLNSNDIDYVIPYHLSGLNKELRLMMSIEQWVDYTRKQNERKIGTDKNNTSDKNWHKSPKFSEWFDEAAAAKAEDGYAFMREAARKYISLCEERGLEPKFNEFKTEENYWKLLIDRKMVNQKTGKVILQQAVKPIFDENAITVAQNAIADEQAIKDFREVQDSLVEQITSGKVEISKKMTAELVAMQTSLLTSDMNNGAETETEGRMFELRDEGLYNAEYEKPITAADVETLRTIGRKSINNFTSEDIKKAQKWAYKFYREFGTKSPFFRAWFGDWRQYDKSSALFFENIKPLNITDVKSATSYFKSKLKSNELFRGDVINKDTNFRINIGAFVYNDTLTYANRELSRSNDFDLYRARLTVTNNIRDIVENAIYLTTSIADGKKNNVNAYQSFYHYFYSLAQIDGKPYMVRLAVDELNSTTTIRRAYNVENIEISPIAVSQVYKPAGTMSDNGKILSSIRISDLFEIVKQYDKDFSPKAVSVELLNPDGTPKVFYHGTASKFNKFDKNMGGTNTNAKSAKKAFFFSSSKKVAEGYAEDARPKEIMELYRKAERLENRAAFTGDFDAAEQAWRAYEEAELAYSGDGYIMGVYLCLRNPFIYDFKGNEYRERTYNDIIAEAKNNGYDGVIFKNTFDASNQKTNEMTDVVAVFDPTNIKSATDNIGTFDRSNQDINYELRYDDTAFDPRRELPDALAELAQNEKERNTLLRYKENADMLNKVQLSLEQAYAELKQAKAAMDGKRMREASDAVKKAENRLNIWDKKLTEMEATKPIKELIARRERQLKEQFARGSTTRAKHRNNIKQKLRSLDQKLRTNSGEKHIISEFQPVVAKLLTACTNNTSVFKRAQLDRLKTIYAKFDPGKDNERLREHPELSEYMAKYAPIVAESIDLITPILENRRLIDLDAGTLAALDNVISGIHKMIMDADKVFVGNRVAQMREIAESSMIDAENSGFSRNIMTNTGLQAFFNYKNALPVYVMERLGNTVMEYLWKPLESASYEMIREQVADTEFLQGKMKQHGYNSWKNKTINIKLESGETIAMTQEQAMSIYALARREETHKGIGGKRINHLGIGGIIIPDIVKENIVDENGKVEKYLGLIPKKRPALNKTVGTPLTDADIAKIKKVLTKEQKAYVDDMVNYMSTVIADRGNAVSQKLYGTDIFNEEYYFPIVSDNNFLQTNFTGQAERLIKNAGMTKSLTENASNPIVVDDFSTVVAQHLLQMERYDTLAVPLDNFNRWLNYQSYDLDAEGNRIAKNGKGVKATLEAVYGTNMTSYINQMLKDANANSVKGSNEGFIDRLIGRFRKNAVLASLSVAIQQPSAMRRAYAYIDRKYFGYGFKTGWTHYHENLDEMLKYSGAAFVKEHGSFDPAVSNNAIDDMLFVTPEGWQKVWQMFNLKDATYRDQVLSALPKAMDRITWVRIWSAVKRETQANNPTMDVNSEEFLKKAGERFDYVINRTQVYDSVLSKSELMRSKSTTIKALTSFGAEPTVAYNMLLKANTDMAMAISKGEGRKTAGKFLARTIFAFLEASFVNALLKSLVTAARKDKPDDEDDKSYLEWYAHQLVNNFISDASPLGLLPIVREVQTALEGYELTNSQLDMLAKMFDTVAAVTNEDKPIGKKLEKIASTIGYAFGIPVENMIRDTGALINVYTDIFDGWSTDWEDIKDAAQEGGADATRFDIIPEPQSTGDKLFNAIMSEDADAYKKAYAIAQEEFNKGKHKTYKNVESYVRAELKKHLAKSDAIIPVYEAYKVLDIKAYNDAIKVLTDKGFTKNDVVWAYNNYKESLNKPKDETVENESYEEEAEQLDKSLLINAIAKGKELEVIAEEQSKYKKGSQEYKDNAAKIKRYITQELKPQYQDAFLARDTNTVAAIYRRLKSYKKYGIEYNDSILKSWRDSAKADRQ